MESVIGSGVRINFGDVGVFEFFETIHVIFEDIVDFDFGAFHFGESEIVRLDNEQN